MASIKGVVDEIEHIEAEIKRNRAVNKKLGERVKELKMGIQEYLSIKGHEGMKYKGKAIVLEKMERCPPRKKADKRAEAILILEASGVIDPEKTYDDLQKSQKGSPIEETKLKFKKLSRLKP